MVIKKKKKKRHIQLKIFQRHLENDRITASLLSSLLQLSSVLQSWKGRVKPEQKKNQLSFIQVCITKGCSGSTVKNINLFQQIIMHLSYSYLLSYRYEGIRWVLRTVFTPDHTVSPGKSCFYIKACWCGLDYAWDTLVCTTASWQSPKPVVAFGLLYEIQSLAGGLSQALLLRLICCARL